MRAAHSGLVQGAWMYHSRAVPRMGWPGPCTPRDERGRWNGGSHLPGTSSPDQLRGLLWARGTPLEKSLHHTCVGADRLGTGDQLGLRVTRPLGHGRVGAWEGADAVQAPFPSHRFPGKFMPCPIVAEELWVGKGLHPTSRAPMQAQGARTLRRNRCVGTPCPGMRLSGGLLPGATKVIWRRSRAGYSVRQPLPIPISPYMARNGTVFAACDCSRPVQAFACRCVAPCGVAIPMEALTPAPLPRVAVRATPRPVKHAGLAMPSSSHDEPSPRRYTFSKLPCRDPGMFSLAARALGVGACLGSRCRHSLLGKLPLASPSVPLPPACRLTAGCARPCPAWPGHTCPT